MDRRRRAGEVVDFVNPGKQRERDVVAIRLKVFVAREIRDVVLPAGEILVHARDIVALCQQPLAQVGTRNPAPPVIIIRLQIRDMGHRWDKIGATCCHGWRRMGTIFRMPSWT